MRGKRLAWDIKYQSWTVNDWKKGDPELLGQTLRRGKGTYTDSDLHNNPWPEMSSFGSGWRCSQEGYYCIYNAGNKPSLQQSFELPSFEEEYGTVLRTPSWQLCIRFMDWQKYMQKQQKDCILKGNLREINQTAGYLLTCITICVNMYNHDIISKMSVGQSDSNFQHRTKCVGYCSKEFKNQPTNRHCCHSRIC
ncbi:hypothetical protein TNCV_4548461 [Trichonephila clavipes]|nr:hypothetical protein TNCV_4548461 [Trichonephila clavipes]